MATDKYQYIENIIISLYLNETTHLHILPDTWWYIMAWYQSAANDPINNASATWRAWQRYMTYGNVSRLPDMRSHICQYDVLVWKDQRQGCTTTRSDPIFLNFAFWNYISFWRYISISVTNQEKTLKQYSDVIIIKMASQITGVSIWIVST